MQIHCKYTGVKGSLKLYEYGLKWRRMITEKAKHKARVLAFWEKYGLDATIEAFEVKERTLYYWKSQLKKGGGKITALNEKSKSPHNVRKREWPWQIKAEIRRIREEHPNLGKNKVYKPLKEFCKNNNLIYPSESTIGNLIRDMGGLRAFPQKVYHNGKIIPKKRVKRARKPKNFIAEYPGHCGSFDTIERIISGCRRYVITFTDVYSRFSLAWATKSHASKAAEEFFDLVKFLFPFQLKYILTDNGSEFMKHFDQELKNLHLIHWHTYPKTPKMNSHVERFNRSIQEEYIDYHESELLEPEKFNIGLMKHLLWYNTARPHYGINLQTPVDYIRLNNPDDCKMYLTNTIS